MAGIIIVRRPGNDDMRLRFNLEKWHNDVPPLNWQSLGAASVCGSCKQDPAIARRVSRQLMQRTPSAEQRQRGTALMPLPPPNSSLYCSPAHLGTLHAPIYAYNISSRVARTEITAWP